jgi:hypothetical protein
MHNPFFDTYDSDWANEEMPKAFFCATRRGAMAVNAEAEAAKKAMAVMNFMVSLFYCCEEMSRGSAFYNALRILLQKYVWSSGVAD